MNKLTIRGRSNKGRVSPTLEAASELLAAYLNKDATFKDEAETIINKRTIPVGGTGAGSSTPRNVQALRDSGCSEITGWVSDGEMFTVFLGNGSGRPTHAVSLQPYKRQSQTKFGSDYMVFQAIG